MKTIFDDGKTKVLLNEETGIVSLVRGNLSCSSEKDGVIVKVNSYREQEICLKEKDEHLGELDGGLELSFHCGSWDWIPGQIIPK